MPRQDEAEERYGDFVDLVDTGRDELEEIRDTYAQTLDEDCRRELPGRLQRARPQAVPALRLRARLTCRLWAGERVGGAGRRRRSDVAAHRRPRKLDQRARGRRSESTSPIVRQLSAGVEFDADLLGSRHVRSCHSADRLARHVVDCFAEHESRMEARRWTLDSDVGQTTTVESAGDRRLLPTTLVTSSRIWTRSRLRGSVIAWTSPRITQLLDHGRDVARLRWTSGSLAALVPRRQGQPGRRSRDGRLGDRLASAPRERGHALACTRVSSSACVPTRPTPQRSQGAEPRISAIVACVSATGGR